jgi:hypothetical protein
LLENIELIKQKANYLENKAKEEEKYIDKNGGNLQNPELSEKFSYMIIDTIKAKLAILDRTCVKDD